MALREVPTPAVGDLGVLVKVRAASVNAADWHLMKRLPHLIAAVLRLPRSSIRGSDLAGQVEAVGQEVRRFKPGDEVFGVGVGAFAEYATSTEDRLAPKPSHLTFEQAAALPVAGCTALQGLRDKAGVAPGQRVLIYGAGGGVGTFAVQIAKALGAHVTAVTRTASLDLMRSIGADEIVDYTKEDFTRRGQSYDVVFDLGANRSVADCRRVLAPGAKLVVCGAPKGLGRAVWALLETQLPHRRGSRITFLAKVRHDDLMTLKELSESGQVVPAIDRSCSLDQVPDAIRSIGTHQARGKIVISIG